MIKRYWRAYGGIHAIVRSPYFHMSLLLTLIMTDTWTTENWWETVISIIPSLIGFTLGGFAIIVTFGNDEFKSILYKTDKDEEHSFVASIGATFVHFILLQIAALMLALCVKSTYYVVDVNSIISCSINAMQLDRDTLLIVGRYVIWFISYEVFIYALITAIAATFAIFRLVYTYQTYVDSNKDE